MYKNVRTCEHLSRWLDRCKKPRTVLNIKGCPLKLIDCRFAILILSIIIFSKCSYFVFSLFSFTCSLLPSGLSLSISLSLSLSLSPSCTSPLLDPTGQCVSVQRQDSWESDLSESLLAGVDLGCRGYDIPISPTPADSPARLVKAPPLAGAVPPGRGSSPRTGCYSPARRD